ncbi:hypothetical protein D1224_09345 [Henriciella barbarensis]|uniref:Uncharacterized protein n=1 Tax=Henriciella barbarensis TaxID=86342 RepID=A0A399R0V7_9PROT|nr:hypothetical protein [Henriciella barbarensis]RIJ24421.1 hypothetical protein D1224_09345 [Henriciella barbarensis]
MKFILGAILVLGSVSFTPIIGKAHAQFGAANCRDGNCTNRRYRTSNAISVMVSKEGQDRLCAMWVADPAPGVFTLRRDSGLSRGDLSTAPNHLIGVYSSEGIAFHHPVTNVQGSTSYEFAGGVPVTKTYEDEGCLAEISYGRTSYDLEASDRRVQVDRLIFNRRSDGLIAVRLVDEDNGNKEVARWVYERTADHRFTNTPMPTARAGALPTRIHFVPGGAYARPSGQRRRTSTAVRMVDKESVCSVAASDDQNVTQESCMRDTDHFVFGQ